MTRLVVLKPNKKICAKFYQTLKGNEPVREWLLKLDVEDRKIIGKDIQKVEFGWPKYSIINILTFYLSFFHLRRCINSYIAHYAPIDAS